MYYLLDGPLSESPLGTLRLFERAPEPGEAPRWVPLDLPEPRDKHAWMMNFSPDGEYLAVGLGISLDRTSPGQVELWHVPSARPVFLSPEGDGQVYAIDFDRDRFLVADNNLQLLAYSTDDLLRGFEPDALGWDTQPFPHPNAFRQLASLCRNPNADPNNPLALSFRESPRDVCLIGDHAVSVSGNNLDETISETYLTVWNLDPPSAALDVELNFFARELSLSPDGRYLAVSGMGTKVLVLPVQALLDLSKTTQLADQEALTNLVDSPPPETTD